MKEQVEPINAPEKQTDDEKNKIRKPSWWDEYEAETREIQDDSKITETQKVNIFQKGFLYEPTIKFIF